MTIFDSVLDLPATAAIPGPRARSLVARDGEVYTPAMGRVYPFAIERGEGCYVWDVDGNRYLDMNAGIAVVAAGHSHPAMVAAIQDQATRFIHMAGTDFYSEPMVRFGEQLTSLMPSQHQWQVFPCNSGTEAIEASIKLARYVTGRQTVIGFFGAFHGRTYGSLSLTASKPYQRRGFFPMVPGTFHSFYANPFRPPLGATPETVAQACLDHIEHTLFTTVVPPSEVAAIVIEPIQGEGGYIVPAPGFICGLRRICDAHGILLIFDEVQSGVGRTGKMWGFEHECIDVTRDSRGCCTTCGHTCNGVPIPDIVASAKGLGGGVPIGAMIARRELMQRWEPGAHGNTYGGNALSCAAANVVLGLVQDTLAPNAARVGAHLMAGLRDLQRRQPQIGDVRGRGLMIGIELVKPDGAPDKARAQAVMERCFERGLLVLTCGQSVIRFCPPLVLTEDQADEALSVFEDVIAS